MFTNADLKKLIMPLFMDQVLLIAVSFISMILITYAGEASLSGVSLVDMINVLINAVLISLASGGAVVVAQLVGRKEPELSNLAASQLIMITTLISASITMFVVLFNQPILTFLFGQVEPDVMQAARIYFLISALSYPFFANYNSSAALFRSMGNTRIPMTLSIVMNITSLVFSYIAIFILDAGVIGIAMSGLFARAIAAIIIMRLTFNKNNIVYVSKAQLMKWDGRMIRRIFNIAIPNSIENGFFHMGKVVLMSIIASFGTAHLVSNGIANNIITMTVATGAAAGAAAITIVGQCIGANEYDQAEYYIKKLMRINRWGDALLTILFVLFLPMILDLFQMSPEARELTYWICIIHNAFSFLMLPHAFLLPVALRAAGDARYAMMGSMCAMAVRVVLGYVFGQYLQMGVVGVWIAMLGDWILRIIWFSVRFKKGTWRQCKVV